MTEEVVGLARQLLVEKGWTRGAYARLQDGTTCATSDPDAAMFCAIGALWRASEELGDTVGYVDAFARIGIRASQTLGVGPVTWNDTVDTLDEALAMLDEILVDTQLESLYAGIV